MREGESHDSEKESVEHIARAVVSVRVTHYRLITVVWVAVMVGVLGAAVAGLSTIWYRPTDGFDGWYPRISAGFVLGSATGGFVSSVFAWRTGLRWLAARWWNPRTWRLRK